MEINSIIHGFKINNISHLEEIDADLYEMSHVKTSARAIWLKRADENKTFSIAFKTTPVDDTGVFHILEHSVLNGSEKYPVREPFVDLLKGSLQTFLNAMTFPDKTVYPVSSRNNKDFINLMRVYLDAVFKPNVLKNPNIFYQEGWHYELNDVDEEPIYKGVVFNEMKGAFSSPDGIKSRLMMHALFPDTCYGNESGGDPDFITDLSYEQFCAAHRKYYNPSNSYIFLDGDIDIENILSIIDDEYLSSYNSDGDKIVIEKQEARVAENVIKEYEISPEEDPEGKAQLAYGYVIGNFDDYEKTIAFSLISSVLSSSNEAPLKKAILSKGLGEDVSFDVQDGLLQPYVEIDVTNTDLEKEEEISKAIREVLENAVNNGIDRKELEAALNQREFKAKERDLWGMPKGLVFAIGTLDSWLYGGNPAESICYNDLFVSLREKLSGSYYEDLIREYLLESKHCASIFLKPSKTLGEEKAQKEREKLSAIASTWSAEEKEKLVEMNKKLQKWQSEGDTPEQKATLPRLHLDDLKKTPTQYPLNKESYKDKTVLVHEPGKEGISYISLILKASDFELSEMAALSQMLSYLGNLRTENYDLLTLSREMRSILGDFSAAFRPIRSCKDTTINDYVMVSWSALERNDEEALKLIKEILYRTDFTDKKAIRDLLKQNLFALEQAYINAGHSLALQRAASYTSPSATIAEYSRGYEAYKYLKDLDENYDEKADEFIGKLKELAERLFISERYMLSVSSNNKDLIESSVFDDAPHGKIGNKIEVKPLGRKNEGIIVSANISYAADCALLDLDKHEIGTMCVLNNILTYDYLWNMIRVKGGAYGCGFRSGVNTLASFHSYRDPSPDNSLKVYADTPHYLEEFLNSDQELENYIVGTTGEFDPLLQFKTSIGVSDIEYLMEYTYEDKAEILTSILNTSKDDVRNSLKHFDKINTENNFCVIGNKEALEKCKDKLDIIFDLKSRNQTA